MIEVYNTCNVFLVEIQYKPIVFGLFIGSVYGIISDFLKIKYQCVIGYSEFIKNKAIIFINLFIVGYMSRFFMTTNQK